MSVNLPFFFCPNQIPYLKFRFSCKSASLQAPIQNCFYIYPFLISNLLTSSETFLFLSTKVFPPYQKEDASLLLKRENLLTKRKEKKMKWKDKKYKRENKRRHLKWVSLIIWFTFDVEVSDFFLKKI